MLPSELPDDLPSFLAQFGTDKQCHAYLFRGGGRTGFGVRLSHRFARVIEHAVRIEPTTYRALVSQVA